MTASMMAVRGALTRGTGLWVALILAAALPQGVEAGTKTFDGGVGGAGTTLDAAANWNVDGIPVTTDEALLDNSVITLPATLTTAAAATFGDLIVNSTTLNTISLTGGTSRYISLSGNGGSTAAIAAGGAASDKLLLGSSVHGTVTIGGGSGVGKLNIALTIADGNFDVVNSDATLIVSGILSGAFNLTKTGLGTLTLSGVNAFGAAKTFTLSAGTVNINSTTALGSATTTFKINDGTTINNTSGAAITTVNANPLNINGDFTFAGGGTLTDHDLIFKAAATTLNGAAGARTITVSAANSALGILGIIANGTASGLSKAGAGTLRLSGVNTFSGTTTISNGKIALGNALALQNSAYDTTGSTGPIGLDVTGYATPTLGGLAGSVNLATAITGFDSISTLTLNPQSGVTVTYSGAIANNAVNLALTKTGTGTQVLSGSNSYNGNTAISAGVLSIAGTGSLPGWDTTARYAVSSGATLAAGNDVTDDNIAAILVTGNFAAGACIGFDTTAGNRPYSVNVADTLSGALGLTKVGSNTLVLTGAKTYTGVTTVSTGTLQLGDGAVNGSIAGASIVDNAELVYKLNGSDVTSANVISGSGNFTKNGAGKLTLSLAQTYTGTTTIDGGTLAFSSTFAGSTQVNIKGASRIELNSFNTSYGAKTFTFDSTGGGVIYANTSRLGSSTIVTSGGLQDSITGTLKGALFTFNVAHEPGSISDLLVSASFLGDSIASVTKIGPGILTLSGPGGYTGGLNIQVGTVQLGNAAGAGSGPVTLGVADDASSGTLDLYGGSRTIAGLATLGTAGSQTIGNSAGTPATLNYTGATATFGGVIKDVLVSGTSTTAVTLNIAATVLTLSGPNTYSGATTVSAGTLRAGVASVANTSGAIGKNSAVTMANVATAVLDLAGFNTQIGSLTGGGVTGGNVTLGSATLTVGGDNTSPAVYAGVISGTGGVLVKIGSGTLTLSGVNTYDGNTTVSQGTLKLNVANAIATSPVISVTSGAVLDVTAAGLTLGASQTLIAGRTGSAATDVNGNLSSGGTLKPAGDGTIGTLTVYGNLTLTGGTLNLDVAAVNASDKINLGGVGTVVVSSPTVINVTGAVAGDYTIVNGSTATIPTGGLSVTGQGTLVATFDNNTTGTLILRLTEGGGAAAVLTWHGTTAPGNVWDIAPGSLNWLNAATPAPFANGDEVTFDGTAAQNSVDIAATVSPSVLTVSGANAITFGGSGSIAGGVYLQKSGSGNLTIANHNTFNGGTFIADGTVTLGHATDALADSGAITVSGATAALTLSGNDTVGTVTLAAGSIAGPGTLTSTSGFTMNNAAAASCSANLAGSVVLAKTGAGGLTLTGNNTYSGGTTLAPGAGAISFGLNGLGTSGAITLSGNATLQWAAGNTQDISSRLAIADGVTATLDSNSNDITFASGFGGSGTGALTKIGGGKLTLSGANTYSGVTTVNAGTLQLGDGAVNGSIAGASIVDNATLAYNVAATTTDTYAGVISGSGALIKSGAGKLILSATQTYSGATTINGGVLSFGNQLGAGQININGASRVELTADNTPNGNKVFVFDSTGGGTIYSGTGSAGPRAGGGTITTSGGARDTLSGLAWKVESSGFTFNVARGTDATSDLEVSAKIGNVGAVTKTGVGILTLSGANGFSGGLKIQAGTVQLGDAAGAGSGTVTLGVADDASSGTLDLYGGSRTIAGLATAGTAGNQTIGNSAGTPATLNYTGATATFGGVIKDVLVSGTSTTAVTLNNAAAVLTLGGPNTFSGATTVSAGTLQAGVASVANTSGAFGKNSAVTMANVATAVLDLAGFNTQIGSLTGGGATGGNVTLGSVTLTVGGDNTSPATYAGVISGTGGVLVKIGSGTLTLSGVNTYDGNTTVSQGTLKLNVANAIATSPVIAVTSGAVLDVTAAGLTLGASQTLIAGRTGSAATDVNGNLSSGATLKPAGDGTIGTLTVHGNLTLTGGTLNLDVAAVNASDKINLDVAGTVAVSAPTVINVSGAVAGEYTIIDGATGTIPTADLSVTGVGELIPTFNNSIAGTLVLKLTAAGAAALTWNGTTAPGNVWDTAPGSLNWLNGAAAAPFANGDGVTFDGSAAQNSVDIAATVSPSALVVSGANVITFIGSGSIAGSVSLQKSGAGNLTVDNHNTFSSGTFITEGTVTLGHATDALADSGVVSIGGATAALALSGNDTVGAVTLTEGSIVGSGTLTSSSGFTMNNTASVICSAPLAGSVVLAKTGAGVLTLTGNNSYSGGTTLAASLGGISFGPNGLGVSGAITFTGNATIQWVTGNTQDISSRLAIGDGVTATLDSNGNDLTFASGFGAGGTGALTKAGAGTLMLQGASTYSGITTLAGGALSISADNQLGTSTAAGALTLSGGTLNSTATFALGATRGITLTAASAVDVASGTTLTIPSVVAGTFALTKQGLGTLVLSNGANSWGGAGTYCVINAGTLSVSADNQLGNSGSDIQFTGAGTFRATTGFTLGAGRVITIDDGVTGTFEIDNGQTLTVATGIGSGTAALTKTGLGTLQLNAACTYTGLTEIQQGTLKYGIANALSSGALKIDNNGTVDMATFADTVGTVTLGKDGTLTGTTGVLTTDAGGFMANDGGTVSGFTSGALSLGGNLTYNDTISGSTTLSINRLYGGGASTRTFTIARGDDASGIDLDIASYLGNSGAAIVNIVKDGAGTMQLSGTVANNNFSTGTTSISDGTLLLNKTASVFAIGGTGLITVGDGTGAAGTAILRHTAASSIDQILNNAATINSDGLWDLNGKTETTSGALTLNSGGQITIGAGSLTTGAAGISGSITATGAGVFASTAVITINSGGSILTAGGAVTGTALTVNNGGSIITGGGNLVGTAALIVNGSVNTGGGNLTGTSTLAMNAGSIATGVGTFNLGGTLTLTGAGTASTLSGNLNLGTAARSFSIADGAASIDLDVPAVVVNGVGGGITKTGVGLLQLSGANGSYSGPTLIQNGTVRVTQPNGLGTSAVTQQTVASTLQLWNNGSGNNGTITYGNNLTLGTTGNTIDLNNNGANTGNTVELGTLSLGAHQLNVTGGNGYVLRFTGTTTLSANLASFNPTSANLELDGAMTGNFTWKKVADSAGTLTLGGTAANVNTALVTINAGGILLLNKTSDAVNAIGAGGITVIGNTAQYAATAGNDQINDAAPVTLANGAGLATLDLNGKSDAIGSLTFGGASGVASSQGTVTTGAGTLTLGGNVTYTATGNPLGASIAGNLNLGAATCTFTIGDSTQASSELTISAPIGATGLFGLIKAGTGVMTLSGASSYTGPTTINGGTLSINSIKDVNGGNSAIGNPAPGSGAIAIGSGAAAGVLVYTGTGDTTDRAIDLAGTTGGVTLDQSGSAGLLKFTANFTATGAADKTLTLQGSTVGAGEIAGQIVNNTGANITSLIKGGSGKWTLSGINTYTGATSLNAGTLVVSGSLASTMTVAGSAVLSPGVEGDASTTMTLTGTAGLSLGNGSFTTFECRTSPSVINDQIRISGSGTLVIAAGAKVYLHDESGANWTTPGTYYLIEHNGTYVGTPPLDVQDRDPGLSYSFGNDGDWIFVQIASENIWDGGTGLDWQTGANWTLGTPISFVNLFFRGANSVLNNNGFAAGFEVGGISFDAAASGAFTLEGNSINLNGNVVNNTPAVTHTLALPLVLMAATREFNTASGGLTVSGEISDSGAALGLTKTGTGTLTFTGANTYSGDTTVNAGTLQLGDGTVNGSIAGASIVNNASLVYKLNGSDVTVANVISGGGNFTKSGTGKLTLSVAQTYTGVTTVNSGTLAFSSTIAGVQVNINGASRVELNADNTGYAKTFTFDSAGGGTLYGSTGVNGPRVGGGTITTSGGARDTLSGTNWKVEGGGFTFNVADGDDATSDLQVSARITNVGAVTKTGNGILAFSAANVYTGGTTVSNGTLRVNNASGSGTGSGAVEVKAGATLGGSGAIGGGVAVAATGTLDAGSASNVVGQIAITNGVTFAANAILHVDITDDSNADRVEAGGLVSGGMVNVDVNAPPSLTIGSVWTIVHSSQPITATFAAPARYQIVLPDAYTVQLHFPPLSGTVFRFH